MGDKTTALGFEAAGITQMLKVVELDNPPGLFEHRCGQERAGKEWPLFFCSFGGKKVDGVARTYASTYGKANSMKWS